MPICLITALRWPSYSGLSPSALFDYRLNPWFVEAATSAKDIVILADFSNAMSDYKLSLVRATALAALDTLGANDFVNVLSLESSNYEIVPCFKETIVQVNQPLQQCSWYPLSFIKKYLKTNIGANE